MTNDEIPNDEGSSKSKGRVQWFRISGFCILSSFLRRLRERAIPLCGKRFPLICPRKNETGVRAGTTLTR